MNRWGKKKKTTVRFELELDLNPTRGQIMRCSTSSFHFRASSSEEEGDGEAVLKRRVNWNFCASESLGNRLQLNRL